MGRRVVLLASLLLGCGNPGPAVGLVESPPPQAATTPTSPTEVPDGGDCGAGAESVGGGSSGDTRPESASVPNVPASGSQPADPPPAESPKPLCGAGGWELDHPAGTFSARQAERAFEPLVEAVQAKVCGCLEHGRTADVPLQLILQSTPDQGVGGARLSGAGKRQAKDGSDSLHRCFGPLLKVRFERWHLPSAMDPSQPGTIAAQFQVDVTAARASFGWRR